MYYDDIVTKMSVTIIAVTVMIMLTTIIVVSEKTKADIATKALAAGCSQGTLPNQHGVYWVNCTAVFSE